MKEMRSPKAGLWIFVDYVNSAEFRPHVLEQPRPVFICKAEKWTLSAKPHGTS